MKSLQGGRKWWVKLKAHIHTNLIDEQRLIIRCHSNYFIVRQNFCSNLTHQNQIKSRNIVFRYKTVFVKAYKPETYRPLICKFTSSKIKTWASIETLFSIQTDSNMLRYTWKWWSFHWMLMLINVISLNELEWPQNRFKTAIATKKS